MNFQKLLGLISLILILMIPSIHGEFVVDDSATTFVVNHDPMILPSTSDYTFNSDLISIKTNNFNIIACDSASAKIFLENRNNIPVAMNVQSDGPDFVSYSETSFVLDANSKKEIAIFARAPCNAKGDYVNNFIFEIEDENPIEYELKQIITVRQVNNLGVTLINSFESECPLDQMKFEFEVLNTGTFSEEYSISLGKYTDLFALNIGTLKLIPNTKQKVTVFGRFTPEYYGNFTIPITIEAKNNGFIANFELDATVERCHGFSLNGSSVIDICQDGDGFNETYFLKNLAKFGNDYEIDIVGEPTFIDLKGDFLVLESESTGLVPINLNPQSTEGRFSSKNYVGSYNFSIIAESKYGDLELEKDIVVNVNRCYDLNLSAPVLADNTVCKGDSDLPLSLSNLGDFDETFYLELSTNQKKPYNADIALSRNMIPIASGDVGSFDLIFNSNESIDLKNGKFYVDIVAKLANRTKIYDELRLEFNKVSDTNCYDFKVIPRSVYIVSEENVTKYNRLLNVTNEGIRNSTYDLALFDETNESTLDQSSVSLNVGESKTIILSTVPTNVTANKNVVYVVGTTHGVAFENKVKIYYNYSLAWVWLLLLLLFLIFILLFLIVLVVKKKGTKNKTTSVKAIKEKSAKKSKSKKKGPWWLWLLLLLLLLAVILLVVGLVNSSSSNDCGVNETNCTNINDTYVESNESSSGFISSIVDWFKFRSVSNETVLNETAMINETLDNVTIGVNETDDVIDSNITETNTTAVNETKTSLWSNIKGWFKFDSVSNETALNETTVFNETLGNDTIGANETLPVIFDVNGENKTVLVEKFIEFFSSENIDNVSANLSLDECFFSDLALDYIETNDLEDSFEYYVIPKDSGLTVDLNDIFYDPDGDKLFFGLFNLENMNETINGSKITIEPDVDFCGVQLTKFYAKDPNGGYAETPSFAVIVSGDENLFNKYSSSILAILLVVLVILLILLAVFGLGSKTK